MLEILYCIVIICVLSVVRMWVLLVMTDILILTKFTLSRTTKNLSNNKNFPFHYKDNSRTAANVERFISWKSTLTKIIAGR